MANVSPWDSWLWMAVSSPGYEIATIAIILILGIITNTLGGTSRTGLTLWNKGHCRSWISSAACCRWWLHESAHLFRWRRTDPASRWSLTWRGRGQESHPGTRCRPGVDRSTAAAGRCSLCNPEGEKHGLTSVKAESRRMDESREWVFTGCYKPFQKFPDETEIIQFALYNQITNCLMHDVACKIHLHVNIYNC